MKFRPLLIASVGNPGERYARTPHSAGHIVANAIQSQVLGGRFSGWAQLPTITGPALASIKASVDNAVAAAAAAAASDSSGGEVGAGAARPSPMTPLLTSLFGGRRGGGSAGGRAGRSLPAKKGKIQGTFAQPDGAAPAGRSEFQSWSLFKSGVYMNVSGDDVWPAWRAWTEGLAEAYGDALERAGGSGEGVHLQLALPALVILHDELELDMGQVRVRGAETSARGHRGLLSIGKATPAHMKGAFLAPLTQEMAALRKAKERQVSADVADGQGLALAKPKRKKQQSAGQRPDLAMAYKIGIGIGRPEERTSGSVAEYVLTKMKGAEMAAITGAAEDVVSQCRKIARGEL